MRDEHGYPIAIAAGARHDDEGGTLHWALYLRSDVTEELAEWPHAAEAITGWEAYTGSPGGSFAHNPHLRQSNTRVLVTQQCGLDI